jgi:hypothetical protein
VNRIHIITNILVSYKMQAAFWPPERLLASYEGLRSTNLRFIIKDKKKRLPVRLGPTQLGTQRTGEFQTS